MFLGPQKHTAYTNRDHQQPPIIVHYTTLVGEAIPLPT